MTFQFSHRSEKRECLQFPLGFHQSRYSQSPAHIRLGRQERLNPLNLPLSIESCDNRLPKITASINSNVLQPASLLQKLVDLVRAFYGMEIPSQAKVIPPESIGHEEVYEAGKVGALDCFVEGRDPFFGCVVNVCWFYGLDLCEVFDWDVDRAGFDTLVGRNCLGGHALGGY